MFFDSEFGLEEISRECEYALGTGTEIVWGAPSGLQIVTILPNTVYNPREDTDLLAESIFLRGRVEGKCLFEIGVGSGVVSLFSANLGWKVSGCDINPLAVACTRELLKKNDIGFDSISEGGPGYENPSQWIGKGEYDLIVWNLPYLEIPKAGEPLLGPLEESGLLNIENADVRLLEAIEEFPSFLKDDGRIILICNDNEDGKMLRSRWLRRGWASRIVKKTTMNDGEELYAIELWRPWSKRKLTLVDEIESTNTELIENGSFVGQYLRANRQTSGRGRMGNSWDSTSEDFTASWLIYDGKTGELNSSVGEMQLRVALAILDAICASSEQELASQGIEQVRKIAGSGFTIKWPNDIWYNCDKISGVLVDSKSQGEKIRIVIGIGVNFSGKSTKEYLASSITKSPLVNCSIVEFETIIDASISTHFENQEDGEETFKIPTNELIKESVLQFVEFNGRPSFLGNDFEIVGINDFGHLEIIDSESNPICVSDTRAIDWGI